MFKKILIANRGEIAVRIIRACHSLGIQTVAIYAQDDRESLHVKLASEAFLLKGDHLSETYLNAAAILEIAQRAHAEAVHPGYGFLSENADFSAACESAGLRFIGPSAEVMRVMGSKIEARKQMHAAGVPITPGSPPLQNITEAQSFAELIGYPILLKASAGGGGRGMKRVENAEQLPAAFESAQREALSYFGDDTVYLEKFVLNPRHIEVQILGDNYGNVIHLGERDCSIQRRNQKVLEESPAPHLPANVRKTLLEAAVAGAKALNYTSAGTFEFVVQDNVDAYFMEVNTRLQVEHPITEMVTGLDLVCEQIRIAAGEPISLQQAEVKFNGHAIECRITIEDARQNFRPIPGRVGQISEPRGPWVRVDSMLQSDYEIPGAYDSLVAKLVAWGHDRPTAILRLTQALKEYKLEGVTTLLPFFKWLMDQPDFVAGHYTTGFLTEHFQPELLAAEPFHSESESKNQTRQVLEMEVNGKRFEVTVYVPESSGAAKRHSPKKPGSGTKTKQAANPNQITAPMAGTIVKVNLTTAQEATEGQMAFVIESMKMENDLLTERSGRIKSVNVSVGEKVQAGTLLAEFESD